MTASQEEHMSKTGGILGIIGGIFGIIAAVATLFMGGLGAALEADGAKQVIGFGWGGVLFSFGSIVFGAVAFAKPKGAGLGLIVTSLAGAVLGGTFVAVCMVLSLIGGVLAFAGRKKTAETVRVPVIEGAAPTPKTGKWKRFALGIVGSLTALIVGLAVIGANQPSPTGSAKTEVKRDPLDALATDVPAPIAPGGDLAALFAYGTKSTDVQRETGLAAIKGKLVAWTLPVYEVKRNGDNYKIQTSGSRTAIGTYITITPRNDEDRRFIEALTTGQAVAFRGIVKDVFMRDLVIAPAILDRPKVVGVLPPVAPSIPSGGPDWISYRGMPPYTFITDARVRSHIALKVGESYAQLADRLEVGQEMTLTNGFLVGQGCAAHKCGTDEAFIALDTRTSEVQAIIIVDGIPTIICGETLSLPQGVSASSYQWIDRLAANSRN
jgi:hypothetical protein